ncbi:Putative ATP-binding protein YdiF, partial [Durusdinium trenchii]
NPVHRADATLADVFHVRDSLVLLDRAERGEATAEELANADWTLEARLDAALAGMDLDRPLDTRLSSLSGGQRTRAGLAALMFAEPDALLLDEPTNHLDSAGRRCVIDALRAWQGCVIVASHDRALLREMDAIVELTTLGARSYGCNYDNYREMKAAELASAKTELARNPVHRADATLADVFHVRDSLVLLDRAERGEATAEELANADWTLEARLDAALAGMDLDRPLDTRLSSLSGGQRTRAGLAALMFAEPDALLLDEPTNHLDSAGRRCVIDALRAWQGCVIVASHDRALLREMDAIVELTTLGARSYGCNYDNYREMKAAELASAKTELAR